MPSDRLGTLDETAEIKFGSMSDEPWRALSAALPVDDLMAQAQAGVLPAAILGSATSETNAPWEILLQQMCRGLFRRHCRHLLVTGPPGVGKTTLVRGLAHQGFSGAIPFLKPKRFLRVDCREILPEESRQIGGLLLVAFSITQDLILCLDGLGALLRAPGGMINKGLLWRLLRLPHVHVIGILSQWDFDELLSGDARLLEQFTVVSVPEPDEETALAIVREAKDRIESSFRLEIDPRAVDKAVTLSAKYIWNERLPQKAIGILERVCEEVDFERSQRGREKSRVEVEDVLRAVSEISRVPLETLTGDIDDTDYEQLLGASVVGQREAVEAIATELRLIRAGITDPGKPAAVMLFCGLNGVGKTELAKKLAEIYSATKRLQTYTMGNFVESHAVSGIIGVPAGYVGHDQGGRLINDLNADPYGVFLIDEIEKAHPDVMKPFLNLFDEGWIVDQRGVKAYADRAIFILTSNAGYEAISQMHQDNRPMAEIAEHVKGQLATIRNERSSQPVLSTAFLSRIKRIVIFNPLGREAMSGITRLLVRQMARNWRQHRDRVVEVAEDLIERIADEGFRLNEKDGRRRKGSPIIESYRIGPGFHNSFCNISHPPQSAAQSWMAPLAPIGNEGSMHARRDDDAERRDAHSHGDRGNEFHSSRLACQI